MPRTTYKARIVEDGDPDAYDHSQLYEEYHAEDAANEAAEFFHSHCDRYEDGDWPMRVGVRELLEPEQGNKSPLGPEEIFIVSREFVPEFSAYQEEFDHPRRFHIHDYLTRRAYCTRARGHDGDCGDFRDDWDGHSELPPPPYCQRQLVELRTHEAAL